ncbi:hypothetical protein FB451DRAFT_1354034 [Mycena latifolia]|nr:hypothetical protein FB451DRAFT_1354034 [Mycena latifolia]
MSSHLTSMFIPEVVSLRSQTNPNHPFYVYAKPDPSDEIVSITNFEFARATHRAAQLLRPNSEGADGQVVAILALSDTVLYQTLVVGLITANLIPFPISPRNSPVAVLNLLRKTSCHRLIATRTTLQSLLAGLQHELVQVEPNFPLSVEEVPSLAQIYPNLGCETPDCAFELYPSEPNRPSLDDICIYLHSSGSTGLPKPIAQTHRTLMQWASNGLIQEIRDKLPHPVAMMPLPTFHLMGLYGHLMQTIYGGITAALYPPTALTPEALPVFPTPDNILANTRKTNSKMTITLPALLAVWSTSPEALAFLKTLSYIGFGGGCLPRRLGDALLKAGLNIRALYGASEIGCISSILPSKGDEEEWEWLHFSEKIPLRWVPQGDGTFECQVLHSDTYAPSVENLSDTRGYATSDLFVNHPEKKHLWKIVGRTDDVIIHLSGENTVPAPIEDVVMSSPHVAAAIMFGRDKSQTGILIEPTPKESIDIGNPAQVAAFIDKLWPIIEEANSIAPKFSRIFRDMVVFTSPEKSLPRSAKGTVLRKAALAAFEREIEAAYDNVEEPAKIDSQHGPTLWDTVSIQQWLVQLVADLLEGAVISPDRDLFEQGFDSLCAAFLKLRVVGAMRSSKDTSVQDATSHITQNPVYLYRTISQLAHFLSGLVTGTRQTVVDSKQVIDEMILKYTSGLSPSTSVSSTTIPATVLLTGSTGSLGSQILASLVKDSRVTKIYAFNRPSAERSLAERHQTIFSDRGLDIALLDSPKLVFVEGEINQPCFGVSQDVYDAMRNSVTVIIHNAWTLDFNLPLASFEDHISGTRRLIDFALSCARPPAFIFTSSISSVLSDGTSTDASVVASSTTGYGESKFVAEQILAKSGLHAACLRIGQISGALPKGAWSTTDWFPILVKTSITLGHLPEANALVSWIDFETVAQAVLDVAFDSCEDPKCPFSILNLVHPQPVPWNFVMASVRDVIKAKRIGDSPAMRLVDFSEWCAELESFSIGRKSTTDYASLPGIKLLDFFSSLAKTSSGSADSEFGGLDLNTDEIQAVSSSVRSARKLGTEDVARWLEYWTSTGFL